MLQLCSACQRHVKSLPCPFCGAAETAPVRGLPSNATRLSRAQLIAGAALVGLVGCGSEDSVGPVYGAPPDETTSSSGQASSSGEASSSGGGSSSGESSSSGGGSSSGESSSSGGSSSGDNSSGAAPAYGAPPSDGGLIEDDAGTSGTAPAYGAPPDPI